MSLKKIIFSVASVLLIPWYVMSMEVVDQSHKNNQVLNGTMHTTSYIIQGGKGMQEDVVHISREKDQPILAAVFDGNSGIGQDAINKDLLRRIIQGSNRLITDDGSIENVENSIKNVFEKTNNLLNTIERTNEYGYTVLPWHDAGSTALVLFLISQYNKFIISWCGDSEAIWSENGALKSTMPAHHLEKRAGQYSFYRSFGNFIANNPELSKFVAQSGYQMTAEPDVLAIDANNTEWMLMATDGLWTYTSKKEVFDVVKKLLEKRKKYLLDLKPGFDSDLDFYEKQKLIKAQYTDQKIVKKVIILSILNDVKHNLIEKWFQFFFKEYIKIIFPAFRGKNVKKNSYISNLKCKVIELIRFMHKVEFVLDDFPFTIFSQHLQAKNYMALSYPSDNAVISAMLAAGKRFTPSFRLADEIEEHEFPDKYTVNPKTIKEELNSIDAIIRYLYCNLDDGTLADRLRKVFNLNFATEVSEEHNNAFCYQQRCFLEDLQENFLIIQKSVDKIKKNGLLDWGSNFLDATIRHIECFASDNTAIVFLNKEENEQKVPT